MIARLPSLVKTFTFRLALVYVGLFSLSIIMLFAFIYSFAQNYTVQQVENAIKTQYSYLLNAYRDIGSIGVEERIGQLIVEDDEGKEIYLLVNKEFEKLAGNLNVWPSAARPVDDDDKEGKWVTFYIESARNVSEGLKVKAFIIPLSKWRYLMVGRTTQDLVRIEQIIIQTFWASMIMMSIMAFIGAIIMTRSVMKRINVINRASSRIMSGDLSTRIPHNEGGDEFDDLSSNLNKMLDKIEMLLQSISLFANNIAHDLRSPLNRIISRLDDGLRKIEPENSARQLLEKNITDMEGLIATFNSILKISELEASAEFRSFDEIPLGEILIDLVELYEPTASEKGVSIDNCVEKNVCIKAEKNLLTQALANLIDNAIKFTPAGGKVSISHQKYLAYQDIIIADSGDGIPESYRDKVFEKFFRMEESRHTKGNGLGLSLVAAIARIHSAEILLEDNKPGLLVRFRLKL